MWWEKGSRSTVISHSFSTFHHINMSINNNAVYAVQSKSFPGISIVLLNTRKTVFGHAVMVFTEWTQHVKGLLEETLSFLGEFYWVFPFYLMLYWFREAAILIADGFLAGLCLSKACKNLFQRAWEDPRREREKWNSEGEKGREGDKKRRDGWMWFVLSGCSMFMLKKKHRYISGFQFLTVNEQHL